MTRYVLLALTTLACSGQSFAAGGAADSNVSDSADAAGAQAPDAAKVDVGTVVEGSGGSSGMGEVDSGAGEPPGGDAGIIVHDASGGSRGSGGSPVTGSGGASPFIHCEDAIPCGSCTIPNGVMTVLQGCCRADHVCGYLWDGNCGPATASGCPY